ncbi:MAG: C-terminal binding protein [Spirochaetales bacterium]|nr:C-terminal binding protein [Spirochaetales bacterium]
MSLKKNWKIVVTDDRYGNYKEEEKVFEEVGAELVIRNFTDSRDAIAGLKDADAILNNLFPMTDEVISSLTKCKVISRYGVGYDNVNVKAATDSDIWVARVPDYASEDTSDQALALFLGCVRKIAFKDRAIRTGSWNLHKEQPNYRITGKTFGIIGYGGVGVAMHRKLAGLSLAKVLIHDPSEDPDFIKSRGGRKVDLDELLRQSDYISLHLPLKETTRHLIDRPQLEMMKERAILINTSRGGVINEAVLAEFLKAKRIAGAGLDVFETEPLPEVSPLRALDNVILSDHAGWYSEESLRELKMKAAMNIVEVLKGNAPLYPVNSIASVLEA